MRRIVRILSLVLVMSLVFSGCGAKNKKASSKEEKSTTTQENVVDEKAEADENDSTTKAEADENDTATKDKQDADKESSEKKTDEAETSKTTEKSDNGAEENTTAQIVDKGNDDTQLDDVSNNMSGLQDYDEDAFSKLPSYSGNSDVSKAAKKIISQIIKNGMSDFEKAKAIHDYMVVNIDYDYDNYCAGTIPRDSYEISGALLKKYAVCSGYAKTFKYLCDMADLECTYVTGTARGSHAWNQVKIDGKWYNVDVTWDDPVETGKAFDDCKYNSYKYFLVSDAEFTDHKAKGNVKTCNDSLRAKAYAAGMPWVKGGIVKDTTGVQAAVKKAVADNSDAIIMVWDKEWMSIDEMRSEVKNALYKEFVNPDGIFKKTSYSTYVGSTIIRVTFTLELDNGKYEKLHFCDTTEKLQNEIAREQYWEHWVYYATSMDDDGSVRKALSHVFDQKGMNVDVVQVKRYNEVISAMKVNTYYLSADEKAATKAYSLEEVEQLISDYAKDYNVKQKYINYVCKDYSKWEESIKQLKASVNTWENNYCVSIEYSKEQNEIGRYIFYMYEDVHSYGKWVKLRDASCIHTEYWEQRCEKCNRILNTMENPANGVHDGEWIYIDDSTRYVKCKTCLYEGQRENLVGNVWGYYDYDKAAELLTCINDERKTIVNVVMDDWGNVIGTQTPPQVTESKQLIETAKMIALQMASTDLKGGNHGNQQALWCSGVDKAISAYSRMTLSSTGRNLMGNAEYDSVGVVCFMYDQDGTGLNMVPVWCVVFG